MADRISNDLALIQEFDRRASTIMEKGARQIRQALEDRSPPLVEGIAMLEERDGLSETVAEARFTGFLVDFMEILTDAAARR